MLNCVDASFAAPISEEILSCDSQILTLCCLGAVDPAAGEAYARDLAAMAPALADAALSFAMPLHHAASPADALLQAHGILPLQAERAICSRLFHAPQGKLALITYL